MDCVISTKLFTEVKNSEYNRWQYSRIILLGYDATQFGQYLFYLCVEGTCCLCVPFFCLEGGGSRFLWNSETHLGNHMKQHRNVPLIVTFWLDLWLKYWSTSCSAQKLNRIDSWKLYLYTNLFLKGHKEALQIECTALYIETLCHMDHNIKFKGSQ